MIAEKLESKLAVLEKHSRVVALSPFVLAGIVIILYYLGDSSLLKVLDFITFSPGK